MLKLEPMRVLLVIFFLISPFFISQAQGSIIEEARAYREEGYRLQSMGDLKGALIYYEKAAQMDPHFAAVFNDIGVISEALGDEPKALAMYQKAIQLDPSYLATYANLAFLYEKKGDLENAALYWNKRFELGQEGDYWWEIARQRLLELGKNPQVRKKVLEVSAARLSREVTYKRDEEKLKVIKEAKLHFDIGQKAFLERDYAMATKEFALVLHLDPADDKLKSKAREFYEKSGKLHLRDQALADTKSALDYINSYDYLAAGEKLNSALSAVSRISQ